MLSTEMIFQRIIQLIIRFVQAVIFENASDILYI